MSEAGAMSLNTVSPVSALTLRPGPRVEFEGCPAVIERVLDFDAVLLRAAGSGTPRTVSVAALRPLPHVEAPATIPDLTAVAPEAWAVAQKRYGIISPFLNGGISHACGSRRACSRAWL
jgi:hypothetical protein